MADSDLSYTFTCPSCGGSFSILLERIPPVQARFRCPHCKQPMDFPSRDEARVYARLQEKPPASAAAAPAPAAMARPSPAPSAPPRAAPPAPPSTGTARESPSVPALTLEEGTGAGSENVRFRVEKPGFEADVFDRRSMRNLIRSGEVDEKDRVRMDEAEPVPAVDLPFLKSLFSLRKTSRVMPPTCCRTHTERVAHFRCRDSSRPLCEECSPEKKFGATVIRVCSHCGGTATELVAPTA
ncbi:MAG: hypothetical protein M3S32_04795 [Acidobacteriota bacterium]|nr:hypothetical protein [Acidobacteriota bacterium]